MSAILAMTEDELMDGLLGAAHAGGWLAFHVRRSDLGLVQGSLGFPDLVAVHRVRRQLLFLEAKAATGRVEDGQRRWLDALARAGVDARVVWPADYDSLVTELVGDRLLSRRRGARVPA